MITVVQPLFLPSHQGIIRTPEEATEQSEKPTLLDHGKIKPSKSLQNSIASMMSGNREFIMIDEQRVVFEEILKISEKCQKDHKKRTVICTGGPGTGKSVVAVQLLAELTQRDQFVQYVSISDAGFS